MTDTRLRTAARQAALDGSPEARAAWLRERLRSQDTPCVECRDVGDGLNLPRLAKMPCPSCAGTGLTLRPRVELAAQMGDAAARLVLPKLCGVDDKPHGGCCSDGGDCWECQDRYPLELWLSGLPRWGPSVQARAAVAAARVALQRHEKHRKEECDGIDCDWAPCLGMDDHYGPPRRAIEAAEAWLACPCEEHARAAEDHTQASSDVPFWAGPLEGIRAARGPERAGHAENVPRAIVNAARLAGEVEVREAIQRTLIAWALS